MSTGGEGETPPASSPQEKPSPAGEGAAQQEPKPMLRYLPSDGPAPKKGAASGAGLSGIHRGSPPATPTLVQASEDDTLELPPDYYLPEVIGGRRITPLSRGATFAVTTVIVLFAVVAGAVFLPWRSLLQHSNIPFIGGCGDGSACQVANNYLAAYTGGDYEAMYALTSNASHQRFSNPAILGNSYKDAHDYIVHRTSAIIDTAEVSSMRATAGDGTVISNTKVTIPVQLSMTTARVGEIEQTLTIPVVSEQGAWKVDWSPGLIFSKLDDPADPTYQRLVHVTPASGHRGEIVDRDGNVLAKDDTVYQVAVVPSQIRSEGALDATLGANLDLTADQVKASYQGGDAGALHVVRTITAGLYNSISASIQLPGVQIKQTVGRVYPYGSDLAPVTGYVQQVSPDDIKNDAQHYYEPGDAIGRAGLEQWGEQYLRPTKGGSLVIAERNADGTIGRQVVSIAERQPNDGATVHTTISLAEQQAAQHQLAASDGHDGGVLAVDPPTGEVRVMGSYPMYDPNNLSLGVTPNEVNRLNNEHGYVNRAVAAVQPTGSLFKVVTLAAGLENGIKPSDIFTCSGSFTVPGTTTPLTDDFPTGHGNITAPYALTPSCDVVFWTISVQLFGKDPNILPKMGKAFGFGQPTSVIGVPPGVEDPGLMPDPDWLKKTHNATWTAVDAANIGIGQGALLASPAQIALMTAAIADNGKRMQPFMVSQVTTPDGAVVASFSPKQLGTLPVSASNLQVIQIAMLGPTNDPHGTSYTTWRDFPITIAAKTGTAQSCSDCNVQPQSWFLAYAPGPSLSGPQPVPQLAVGALVEFSLWGDTYAAPVTKAIFKAHNFAAPPPPATAPTPTATTHP